MSDKSLHFKTETAPLRVRDARAEVTPSTLQRLPLRCVESKSRDLPATRNTLLL